MENYHIQRQLGFRNDSKTFMVFHILQKDQYVLKMIECKDETHANEIYSEVNNIKRITHIYIGKIIETFVHFDDFKKSFYLVVVMPYYKTGNCQQMLQFNWIHKRKIEEEAIKRLYIQIFEMLAILDNFEISHLNLKPENLFYNSQNHHVILCDFGYKSIINDKRRYLRTKPNEFMWISPIIINCKELSKIDVWTVGMIFFASMTTSVMSETEFMQLLQSTQKYDMKKLRNYIKDNYSKDLVNFTMLMLEYDNDKRPNIKEVISMPFYEECFKLYSSHFVSRQNRQKITDIDHPLPESGDPREILHYIWSENTNEMCIQTALKKFRHFCKSNITDELPDDYAKLISDAMDINNVNDKICEYACNSLGYLAMYSNNPLDYVFTRPVIQSVISSLEVHPDNYKLHRYAAAYFIVLSSFSESSILIGKLKGLEILIQALSRFENRSEIAAVLLNAIWNLCVEQRNCEVAMKTDVRNVIINVYEKHAKSPEVLLNAAACLLAIITSLDVSTNPENIFIVYYLLDSLNNHSGYTNLVRYTLTLLENMIAMNEAHAMQFIECQNRQYKPTDKIRTLYGFDILNDLLTVHGDNSIMILCFCNLIIRVVSYEDLVDTMVDLGNLMKFLNKITERYKNSRRLHSSVEAIKDKIAVQFKYYELTLSSN